MANQATRSWAVVVIESTCSHKLSGRVCLLPSRYGTALLKDAVWLGVFCNTDADWSWGQRPDMDNRVQQLRLICQCAELKAVSSRSLSQWGSASQLHQWAQEITS